MNETARKCPVGCPKPTRKPTMRKRVVFVAKFETYVDVPVGATRDEIVEAASEQIVIPERKTNSISFPEPPILHRDGTFKITRVSSMQPTEDLHGNIN